MYNIYVYETYMSWFHLHNTSQRTVLIYIIKQHFNLVMINAGVLKLTLLSLLLN